MALSYMAIPAVLLTPISRLLMVDLPRLRVTAPERVRPAFRADHAARRRRVGCPGAPVRGDRLAGDPAALRPGVRVAPRR